jgi:glutamine synthetase
MRQLDRLGDLGYSAMNIGPEPEFFYFKDSRNAEILDHAGYFDINPVDIGDDIREVTVFALEAMGIPVEYHHAEVAPSQHEIDIRFQEALRMADSLQTHKYLVKEIARRCGVYATFMPKPLEGENGNGMHVHLSIFKDEHTNSFYDKDDPQHLSQVAKQFIAGVLDHSREMAFVTNQFHNSYKRLVPGYEAPVYIAWAERNRSAAVRIPLYKPGKEVATRMELRFPDATANPYFAFAVMLAAGLEGMDRGLEVPDPMSIDLYSITPVEREEMGINSLPHDLFEAVKVAEKSEFLAQVLGDDVMRKLIETKLTEADKYRLHVSSMELREHMVL